MSNKKIILVRHGESLWNKENRFTGWTDVDLTEKGVEEAIEAGKLLKSEGFHFTIAYTSVLKRTIKTANLILDQMDLDWIPVLKTWRLNEKHYGILQGLNKTETAERFGEEQVMKWRRSYDIPAEAIASDNPRSPYLDVRYKDVPKVYLPLTESLKDNVERTLPYWKEVIFPSLIQHEQILVVAHGNSLRGIIKYLKDIPDDEIVSLNMPTGISYVFEFDDDMKLVKDYFLGDKEKIKELMDAVANQGKKS
ncbi:2,3-bisphosphoglycerate-dependent phosphoglycerate mutase [Dysgonomonas hofstadii]|uniref:2,3-bisphosphoglycerate-dependent phosphoglycerate mutase n=1 Tax=Dysgonomonas hofstadii TaxID=637886 RepID=A0A840CR28_9BACT|nr:2,3-diphosphoglycerate-dependent phosphoglycerate mutase [Dysgonomonas hofstadii]MBB4035385.1 2,3-bisphosphoglycerate-dependent phosphoglycerate mutase [Dysgonomonas hofstadii]